MLDNNVMDWQDSIENDGEAFILLDEPPLSVKMPPWAIRIMPSLPWKKPHKDFDEFWQEEILQELPEL